MRLATIPQMASAVASTAASPQIAACATCGHALRFDTDGMGRLLEICDACTDRRRREVVSRDACRHYEPDGRRCRDRITMGEGRVKPRACTKYCARHCRLHDADHVCPRGANRRGVRAWMERHRSAEMPA